MCIIALKEPGVDMPTDEDIKYMFARNPHGAGFAIQGDLKGDGVFRVHYEKGFMNVDDLIKALGPKDKLKPFRVAIHCRIKTSGETDQATTHPFPLSSCYGDLRKTSGDGAVLFHNGVFSGLGGIINEKSSDTQDFVVGVAMRYLQNAKQPSKISQKIVEEIVSTNRVLVLYPKENFPLIKFGTWYEHNGIWYSNMNYRDDTVKSEVTKYTDWRRYYGYDEEDDYYYKSKDKSGVDKSRYDYDVYGANIAELAWPNRTDDWIRFTKKRFEAVKRAVLESFTDANGFVYVRFGASGEKQWILDEENLQIYEPSIYYDVMEALEAPLSPEETDDYIQFMDEEEMEDWLSYARRIGTSYMYEMDGKKYYIDIDNLEAYTDRGIRELFKPGDQGHVRKYLREEGTLIEHAQYANLYARTYDIEKEEKNVY